MEDKYGYINIDGDLVINKKYDRAGIFSEGLAAVSLDNKYGYINSEGELVIDFKFDYADNFSEGLASVTVGKRVGYINKNGEFVIKPIYHDTENFNNGTAFTARDGMYYLLDATGAELSCFTIEERYGRYPFSVSFSEGLLSIERDGKVGFVNRYKDIVIKPQFDEVGHFGFVGGLSAVKINGRWGYIDKEGNMVIEPTLQFASEYFNGELAMVKNLDDKCRYIDKNGKYVINSEYKCATNFSGKYAVVEDDTGKQGLINKQGEIVFPFQDCTILLKWGIVYIIEFETYDLGEGTIEMPRTKAFANLPDPSIIRPECDNMGFFYNDRAYFELNWKMGVIDRTGKVIVPPKFRSIDDYSEGLAVVS